MAHIFLSYAHADSTEALALYNDITASGYPVWLDNKALLVGQNWKNEITRAIRSASAFIALISMNSVDHHGYVQHELKQGLEVLASTPSNQIFVLPVRISDARPSDIQLQEIHWLDLFLDRSNSVKALLAALATIPGLQASTQDAPSGTGSTLVRKFTSMSDVFSLVLRGIPPSTPTSGAVNAFYVTARTAGHGLGLPRDLLVRYPEEITFVLEHQYKDLVCDDASFSVTLWFSGEKARITVPYAAIVSLEEREAGIRIS